MSSRCSGARRGDREPAVAGDDGGDAVVARRGERRVPEDLRVVVGVDVDEPGRDDVAAGVERRGRRRGRCRSRVILPSVIATSARTPGAPVPSTTVPPRMTRSAAISGLLGGRGGVSRVGRGSPARRGGRVLRHTMSSRTSGARSAVCSASTCWRVRERRVRVRVVARPQQPLVVHQVARPGTRPSRPGTSGRRSRGSTRSAAATSTPTRSASCGAGRRRGRRGTSSAAPSPASASTHTTRSSGMPLEHAAEDQRADDVLAAADDAEEAVHLRAAEADAAQAVVAAGQDVERQRQPELDGRAPERVPARVVVVAVRRGRRRRRAASRRAARARLMRSRSAMPSVDAAQRGLADADEAARRAAPGTRRSRGCTRRSRPSCSRRRGGCRAASRPTGRAPRRRRRRGPARRRRADRIPAAGVQLFPADVQSNGPIFSAGRPAAATIP